jgi:two-component system cell cycle response regulator
MNEGPWVVLACEEEGALSTLEQALTEAGYRVDLEPSPARLLATISAHSPDLVVLDSSVNGTTPLEFLRTVRSRPGTRDLPVIVTAPRGGTDETPPLALKAGAADFMRRPFNLEEAVARVAAHVERGRAVREARREAATRGVVLDVMREVTASLSQEEIFHILVRRMATVFEIRRASMILVDAARRYGMVVAAHDDPTIRNLQIDLARYPEIRQAIESGTPVLVRDLQNSALFESLRPVWEREGIQLDLQSIVVIPFEYGTARAGVVVLRSGRGESPFTEEVVRVTGSVVQAAVRALDRAAAFETVLSHQEELEALARTDELTGCLSRRFLMERLTTEAERAVRYGRPLGLVMFDIDDFKQLNDTHGHAAGDEALRVVGAILRRTLRTSDFVGRYGGDEFLVVLPETEHEGTSLLAERVRRRVNARPRDLKGVRVALAVSGGMALYPDSGLTAPEALVERADEALYRAKSAGRNRIEM